MAIGTAKGGKLFRSSVGFDRMVDMFESVNRLDQSAPTYPPYNIEKTGESEFRISLAVARFAEADLEIEAREGMLTVVRARERNLPPPRDDVNGIVEACAAVVVKSPARVVPGRFAQYLPRRPSRRRRASGRPTTNLITYKARVGSAGAPGRPASWERRHLRGDARGPFRAGWKPAIPGRRALEKSALPASPWSQSELCT